MRIRFLFIVFLFSLASVALQAYNNTNNLIIKLYDADKVLILESKTASSENSLTIEREYQQGDYLTIEGAKYMFVQLDETIEGSYVYAPQGHLLFPIPFEENGLNYSGKSFSGSTHKASVRVSNKQEWSAYRNLALNPFDIRGESDFYPHATSNSECRGESWYAARNAIDGNKLSSEHGKWPYHSWGPDKRDDLWFKIDFGRAVEVDKLVIVNRAQYHDLHDSYWESAIVEFSDGSSEEIEIDQTHNPQEIEISRHNTSWVKFSGLKASENKWCAWVEVEVWGKDLLFDKN